MRWSADGLLRAWTWGGCWQARLGLLRVLLVVRRGRRRRPIEPDQVVDDDFDAVACLVGLGVLPMGGMQPAGDVDTAAFVHILRRDLGQLAPRGAARPFGLGLRLAVGIRPRAVGGDAERRASGVLFSDIVTRLFILIVDSRDTG